MSLNNAVKRAEQYFSDIVESGTDQQLFISGYVQGHFFLVLAQCQRNEVATSEQLQLALTNSLDDAFENKELEVSDQIEAKCLVEFLFAEEVRGC